MLSDYKEDIRLYLMSFKWEMWCSCYPSRGILFTLIGCWSPSEDITNPQLGHLELQICLYDFVWTGSWRNTFSETFFATESKLCPNSSLFHTYINLLLIKCSRYWKQTVQECLYYFAWVTGSGNKHSSVLKNMFGNIFDVIHDRRPQIDKHSISSCLIICSIGRFYTFVLDFVMWIGWWLEG